MSLKNTIDKTPGQTEVVLVLGEAESRQIIKLPMKIEHTSESFREVESIVGKSNIKFV